MRTIILLFAAIAVAGLASSDQTGAVTKAQKQAAEDAARLAEALKGRVAGPPQDCVDQRDLRSQEGYGKEAILFSSDRHDMVYVNRPRNRCPNLDAGRAIKTRTSTSRLCRGDVVTVVDAMSGMQLGSCTLGEFTPYHRSDATQGK